MSAIAAVMTGKGAGAISTIQVFGEEAEAIVREIFQPAGMDAGKFRTGGILLGTIVDGAETIDQVTIGCEGTENFAIHCHGNPLIVEMIMQLLGQRGVGLLTAEELLSKIAARSGSTNTIAVEAKLAQAGAKTIEGVKIIANQVQGGLSKKATEWLENINAISVNEIRGEAEEIIRNSRVAELLIKGCKVAIAGPANSGKSTLINCLAGREKAIVTDIEGTTRDWITARCQIDSLSVELIDTAGLDGEVRATTENIDKESERRSLEILEESDVVLLVLDGSVPGEEPDKKLLEKAAGKTVLTVLNKCDLPAGFDADGLPQALAETVQISAKLGTGIEELKEKIVRALGADGVDLQAAVCFTERQKKLLEHLSSVDSKEETLSIITELLEGRVEVQQEA